MRLADRMQKLGTETAFAVAARAAEHAATGARVYPFHLGDLNFKTPAHIVEAANKAIRDGKTGYPPNAGILPLREALAADVNARRGTSYTAENVSIQPGGKPVIGKFLQVLMNPGDEVLCPAPGYPIYESQIEYLGGVVLPYGFVTDGDRFTIDLDRLEQSITPSTRLMIINDFQNPTGASCTEAERKKLAELAYRHNLMVLLDEAYFEIHYAGNPRSIVSYGDMADRSVLLYTFGKKFAMTGWRLGAAIGPKPVIDLITKLNVNNESCTCHFIQYAGLASLSGDQSDPKRNIATLQERRDAAVSILNSIPGVSCFTPEASFYLFPDIGGLMDNKGFGHNYAAFSDDVLDKTGISFCTRLHFGKLLPEEQGRHIRLAYAGIDIPDIIAGFASLKQYAMDN